MERLASGNPQLDLVLGGGFPCHSVNIVMGLPGSGKTILAERLIFANAGDRPILSLTTLSEPLEKVVRYLQQFHFYDEIDRNAGKTASARVALRMPPSALFELAREQRAIDAVSTDLDRFDALLRESPDLQRLVKSPVFTAEEQDQYDADLMEMGGGAVAAIIAAGCGYPGDEKAEAVAGERLFGLVLGADTIVVTGKGTTEEEQTAWRKILGMAKPGQHFMLECEARLDLPADGYNNKTRVLAAAKRIKAQGMKLLVDFHYSDSWADPGKQNKPAAWADLPFDQLRQALYDHTYDVIAGLRAASGDIAIFSHGHLLRALAASCPNVEPAAVTNRTDLTVAAVDMEAREIYINPAAALDEIRGRGNRFLVAGREGDDGRFRELGDLEIPEKFGGLFTSRPASPTTTTGLTGTALLRRPRRRRRC